MNLPSSSQTPLQNVGDLVEIGLVANVVNEMAHAPTRPGHIMPSVPINATPQGIANGAGLWILMGLMWHVMIVVVGFLLGLCAIPVLIGAVASHGTTAFVPVTCLCGAVSLSLAVFVIYKALHLWFKRL